VSAIPNDCEFQTLRGINIIFLQIDAVSALALCFSYVLGLWWWYGGGTVVLHNAWLRVPCCAQVGWMRPK
jgi:hypothetical protein